MVPPNELYPEEELSDDLQAYVKAAVQFMLTPNGVPSDWEQELTANSIMESYGQVLMLTDYELAAYANVAAPENYPKLAACVKSVHHKMVADLIALSPDQFVTAVLEADSIYREYEDRKAAAQPQTENPAEVPPETEKEDNEIPINSCLYDVNIECSGSYRHFDISDEERELIKKKVCTKCRDGKCVIMDDVICPKGSYGASNCSDCDLRPRSPAEEFLIMHARKEKAEGEA